MDKMIDEFCSVREYIINNISQNIECFMTRIWDPMIKYVIIRETNLIINKDVIRKFPDFPEKYIPKIRFRLYENDENDIEVEIQNYFTNEHNLTFLGAVTINSVPYDCYIRDSWDPRFKYMFSTRYGHNIESVFTGSKTAEAEYKVGSITPLSIAYSLAIDDGFI